MKPSGLHHSPGRRSTEFVSVAFVARLSRVKSRLLRAFQLLLGVRPLRLSSRLSSPAETSCRTGTNRPAELIEVGSWMFATCTEPMIPRDRESWYPARGLVENPARIGTGFLSHDSGR